MKRSLSTLLLAILLAGCASEEGIVDKGAYELDTRHQAQAAYPRIKVLVIHYTADDFDTSLATLTDKKTSALTISFPQSPQLHRANRVSGSWSRRASWPGMRASASGVAPTA
ncbi:N-acetylmuramoyl-L-alanine amidase [Enterobacter hormaechei]|nr:N-acetylmuramoyl-L-alanine amidase [Enterobacter hormaechei]